MDSVQVRCLREGEAIPFSLQNGFENLVLQPEWCWVATSGGRIIALLLGCNAHGLLFMLRIIAEPDSPPSTVLRLLRKVLADCRARGLKGYMTYFDLTTPAQFALARIAAKVGGKSQSAPIAGVWMSGTTEVYR